MGCGSLIIGIGWLTGAVQGTFIDAMKIVQVGKLVYLASMCMQVYCSFLRMYASVKALQQDFTN